MVAVAVAAVVVVALVVGVDVSATASYCHSVLPVLSSHAQFAHYLDVPMLPLFLFVHASDALFPESASTTLLFLLHVQVLYALVH